MEYFIICTILSHLLDKELEYFCHFLGAGQTVVIIIDEVAHRLIEQITLKLRNGKGIVQIDPIPCQMGNNLFSIELVELITARQQDLSPSIVYIPKTGKFKINQRNNACIRLINNIRGLNVHVNKCRLRKLAVLQYLASPIECSLKLFMGIAGNKRMSHS